MTAASKRIDSLDALRGLAALAVCWKHLTGSFVLSRVFQVSGMYGWLGVEIFFVISGFVIPYTLYKSGYGVGQYFTFVWKRIVRLEPPYLVSILFVILIGYLAAHAPGYHGGPYRPSTAQVLLHFGYLNAFAHYDWLNGVYWTLAIEFQYYLALGLLFPLLCARNPKARYAALAVLSVLAFIPSKSLMFQYLFLFLLGIVTFQHWVKLIGTRVYIGLILVLGSGAVLTLGVLIAIVAVATACVISFVRFRQFAVLKFLGMISYSLYLVHLPIVYKLSNLARRVTHGPTQDMLAVLVIFTITIMVAYLFYRLVERPSHRWSARIKYKRAEAPSFAGHEHLPSQLDSGPIIANSTLKGPAGCSYASASES